MTFLRNTYNCLLLCFFTVSIANGQSSIPKPNPVKRFDSLKALETGFITVADSIQTSVYWYWLSGNVSKEGVVKDLEAMKKVGINRAFIGDIGLNDVPYGKIKFMSEEWWEIMHLALKTATRLNIQIGLFNGPGWSQAGGPWVRPEQAMRYLTSSEIKVKGPQLFGGQLSKPDKNFQDVKVIAYPVPTDYGKGLSILKPAITSPQPIDSLENLMDHKQQTSVHFKNGEKFALDIHTQQPYSLRSIILSTQHRAVYLEGDVQVKTKTGYVTIKHFTIDRRAPALNFGFLPWARSVISVPASTSTDFRIFFTQVSGDSGISEMELSSTSMLDAYSEKTLAKAWQTEDLIWNAYVWGEQKNDPSNSVLDPAKVIDISRFMQKDGKLTWRIPQGNWIIERTGMTTANTKNVPATPEATGLETDKMSKQHIKSHFDAYIGQVLKRIPAQDRKTLTVVVADSYETGSQNWTDLLLSEFKAKYHYDALPFMPVLQGKVVGSATHSDRFLWDLRRLIADDAAFKYVGGLTEVSHKHGLTTWLENYGYFGFPGEFLQYGGQSDEVAGEFWLDGRLGTVENRAASSAAHIYGKNKVSAESFTSAGAAWRAHPASLKARGDRFFTDGINNTLLHVFIHQPDTLPKPGISAWFGTEFNRGNTWFADMDVFVKYLKRCNLMLQQGRYVADVAYFIGEDAPKLMGTTDPELPKGYSFDYINAEVIKSRLTVKNGRIFLPNGISYGILVLPKQESIRPELLIKIKELVAQGAVILGPKPQRSPSLENYPKADQQVKTMANKLWGGIDGKNKKINRFGKGMVLSAMDMQEALHIVNISPDFETKKNEPVLFIHRQVGDASVYFLSNQKNESVDIFPTFRIKGKKPELWDAVTGTVRAMPAFTQTATGTMVPVRLAANGSAFIVFRNDGSQGDTTKVNYPLVTASIEVKKSWSVSFDKNSGGPEKPVIFNELSDWSVHSNDSIKYYSGSAVYHNTFNLKTIEKGGSYIIDLGLVNNIAKITLNGVELGGVWTAPYQLDITSAIKTGENKLKIRVVNNWVNRLMGDARLPKEKRKTAALFGPDQGVGLQPSGLLGPVKINLIK